MAEVEPRLMTVEEFNAKVSEWGKRVKQESHGALSALTKVYSGNLRGKLKDRLATGRDDGIAKWVGFRFEKYGVFVAYGVGRGWMRQGGSVIRARRVKEGTEEYEHHKKRGYAKKDIRNVRVAMDGGKGRKPKDWLDGVIERHVEELAGLAGEFFGDRSMKQVLETYERMKIKK